MTDETPRLLTPNRRTVLKSIGSAGLATTLQTGTAIGTSGDEYTKLKKSLTIHHKMNRYRDDGKIPDATGNGVVGHPEDEYIDDGFLEFVDDESRGTALEFNGDGTDSLGGSYNIHHEDLPDSLEEGDPITLSVWAKPRNLDEWNSITNNSLGVGIDIRRGEIRARRWEGEHVFMAAADVDSYLTTGEWHHLLATVAPGDEVRLFIDGELAATDSADPDHGFRTAYKAQGVGWLASDADGAFDARFDGRLDDLQFYVGASASETGAERLYESQKAGEEDEENTSASEVKLREVSLNPSEVDGTNDNHTLSFRIVNLSPDGSKDDFSITLPGDVNVEKVSFGDKGGLNPEPEDPEPENPITFSVDPSKTTEADMEIELTLSPSAD